MDTLTHDQFRALFTREGLRPFQPHPGDDGFTPILEVHTAEGIQIYALAMEGLNDGPTRFGSLRQLGRVCAAAGPVLAVRFGSEAWMRAFTLEEFAVREGRLVKSYADKEECMVVFGQMADGPGYMASARLHRRPTGKIASLGDWQVQTGVEHRSPILEAFWQGYHERQED